MSETVPSAAKVTTAAELIDSPPVKKQRPPWPDGVPFKPAYPGAPHARHPVDKAFIKRDEALALGCKLFEDRATAQPQPQPAPAPQPEPQPEPQPQPQPQPAPGAEQSAPDFSDLNGGGGGSAPGAEAEPEVSAEDRQKSHRSLGAMIHGIFTAILAGIFGPRMLSDANETNVIVQAWVDVLEWWQFRVLNPLERLAAAYGMYLFSRTMVFVEWMKARRAKRAKEKPVEVESEEIKTDPEPGKGERTEPPQPESDGE